MQRRTLPQKRLTSALQGLHGRVSAVICRIFERNRALAQSGRAQAAIKIIAKHDLLAGSAINAPTVLLRSAALQSVYSDHLPQIRTIDRATGYRLEAPPGGVLTHLAPGSGKRPT
jgi:hypothetical protein